MTDETRRAPRPGAPRTIGTAAKRSDRGPQYPALETATRTVQLELPTARLTDPDTSHEAGERAQHDGGRLRDAVLALHRSHPQGLTDDEVWARMPGELLGSISKRRGELVAAGLVEDSGHRRPTRRGAMAIVWRLVRPEVER